MSTVELESAGGVAQITLNRPKAGNTINIALAADLTSALQSVGANSKVRAIVLRATGKLFCGGGDLQDFAGDLDAIPANIHALATAFHHAIEAIAGLEKPLVTSVQGTAAGAGVVLAALGDIALASDRVQFHPAYGSIGLTPDGGSTWALPRLMGERRATEMLLTGRGLNADEASEAGLITRVVPHEQLETATADVAGRLAEGNAYALAETKRLLRASRTRSLSDHLLDEAQTISDAAAQPASRAAIKSFLNR